MNSETTDFGELQEETDIEIPDDPGPAVTGNTPLIGSARRSNGLPVIRDEFKDEMDDIEVNNPADEIDLGILD